MAMRVATTEQLPKLAIESDKPLVTDLAWPEFDHQEISSLVVLELSLHHPGKLLDVGEERLKPPLAARRHRDNGLAERTVVEDGRSVGVDQNNWFLVAHHDLQIQYKSLRLEVHCYSTPYSRKMQSTRRLVATRYAEYFSIISCACIAIWVPVKPKTLSSSSGSPDSPKRSCIPIRRIGVGNCSPSSSATAPPKPPTA